ncbi:MAG: T9SS type A sorting domain-containing protein [Flavobacteriales bacterium]|nr:T9SS type A sorting domain-containing protein [Flavobacteriales bacterium]
MKPQLLCALAFGTMASATTIHAQYWQRCGLGTIGPTEVQTLYGDSVSDRLLAGGTFLWIRNENDTVIGVGQAAWNGQRWDSLATRIQPAQGGVQQTFHFLRYEGELYACGGFVMPLPGGEYNWGLARLNDVQSVWEPLECLNPNMNGMSTLVPKQPGSTLYATGYTGSICGFPEACVFRYDGSAFYEWEPFAQIPFDDGNYVGYVFDYLGKTYMTGSYRNPLGSGQVTFMRYNGSSWEYVPGWNTQSPIKEIMIHNDTLFVAGCFRLDTGGPGNLIAAFNGETWNTMGGGLSYPPVPMASCALSMVWWHDALFACGQFNHAGGVFVNKVAKWDGQRWCGLPGTLNTTAGSIATLAIFRDSLYMCGGFTTIDGDTIKQVAKWIGGDAVENCSDPVDLIENLFKPTLLITPNPATNQVTFATDQPMGVAIYDALSRIVWSGRISGRTTINVSSWAAGSYTVRHEYGAIKLLVAH